MNINTIERKCSCKSFRDKLVCTHLVAACIFDKVSLHGLELIPKRIITLRRRKQQLANVSQDQDQVIERVQETSYVYEQPVGRPLNIAKALESDEVVSKKNLGQNNLEIQEVGMTRKGKKGAKKQPTSLIRNQRI